MSFTKQNCAECLAGHGLTTGDDHGVQHAEIMQDACNKLMAKEVGISAGDIVGKLFQILDIIKSTTLDIYGKIAAIFALFGKTPPAPPPVKTP